MVRGIDRIDEDKRQVWFQASGLNPDQDPYLLHYYRVDFDGTDLVALTEGNGNHTVQFSPDRKYLIDTYSRVDLPPVHELRRTSDGKLVCPLEKADTADSRPPAGNHPRSSWPRGATARPISGGSSPAQPGPSRKYPVMESIYAGPQGSFVPKSFSPFHRYAALTELGFIVVQIDGMGTANRSKAFHDVCWHNLKDAGFPDRIVWHKAVGAKYPYYDLDRVGIYGTSAGGQNAAAPCCFIPNSTRPRSRPAAVTITAWTRPRGTNNGWATQSARSTPSAPTSPTPHNLRGKLLLIVGEMDNNVPPESTYRFADALIKAGKDFELLVVPAKALAAGYGMRRLQDFFVRHLPSSRPIATRAACRPHARHDRSQSAAPACPRSPRRPIVLRENSGKRPGVAASSTRNTWISKVVGRWPRPTSPTRLATHPRVRHPPAGRPARYPRAMVKTARA